MMAWQGVADVTWHGSWQRVLAWQGMARGCVAVQRDTAHGGVAWHGVMTWHGIMVGFEQVRRGERRGKLLERVMVL